MQKAIESQLCMEFVNKKSDFVFSFYLLISPQLTKLIQGGFHYYLLKNRLEE